GRGMASFNPGSSSNCTVPDSRLWRLSDPCMVDFSGGLGTPREGIRGQPGKLLPWVAMAAASAMTGFSQLALSAPAASIPDFSGTWRHGTLPWLIPPASGPGPVTNKSRRPDDGTSDYAQLVGDYTNPILQPWAAEVVKKKGEI